MVVHTRHTVPSTGYNAAGSPRHHVAGLTLIEMLLAMAVTALVGAAIASMLGAVTYGTNSSKDMRELVVKAQVLNRRMGSAVRNAGLVLGKGDDHLVLWVYDEDGNGLPSLREIERLQYSAETQTLAVHRAGDDAADTLYEFSTNFSAVTGSLLDDEDTFPAERWAGGVSAWVIDLDDDQPMEAALVSYRMTLVTGEMKETLVGAGWLRTQW